jgi:hypothetical protein
MRPWFSCAGSNSRAHPPACHFLAAEASLPDECTLRHRIFSIFLGACAVREASRRKEHGDHSQTGGLLAVFNMKVLPSSSTTCESRIPLRVFRHGATPYLDLQGLSAIQVIFDQAVLVPSAKALPVALCVDEAAFRQSIGAFFGAYVTCVLRPVENANRLRSEVHTFNGPNEVGNSLLLVDHVAAYERARSDELALWEDGHVRQMARNQRAQTRRLMFISLLAMD